MLSIGFSVPLSYLQYAVCMGKCYFSRFRRVISEAVQWWSALDNCSDLTLSPTLFFYSCVLLSNGTFSPSILSHSLFSQVILSGPSHDRGSIIQNEQESELSQKEPEQPEFTLDSSFHVHFTIKVPFGIPVTVSSDIALHSLHISLSEPFASSETLSTISQVYTEFPQFGSARLTIPQFSPAFPKSGVYRPDLTI
jgi:hypothetical protein